MKMICQLPIIPTEGGIDLRYKVTRKKNKTEVSFVKRSDLPPSMLKFDEKLR